MVKLSYILIYDNREEAVRDGVPPEAKGAT